MVPNGVQLPGGAKTRGRYMNFLKAQGLKTGVSDIVIALPRGPYHGAYMELKRDEHSTIRKDQLDWVALMKRVGYCADIVIGFNKAREFAQTYLKS